MKRLIVFLAVLALVVVWSLPAFAAPAQKPTGKMLFNLQILGKNECPSEPMKDTGRHTIFVLLDYVDEALNGTSPVLYSNIVKTNKIFLAKAPVGESFEVLDGNACDADGAKFQLPDPQMGGTDTLNSPTFAYQVWVRGLGKPGPDDMADPDAVYAKIRTCAVAEGTDETLHTADDEIVCSTEQITVQRKKGKPVWQLATKELLSLCLDLVSGGSGCDTRVTIFDPMFYDYFWAYDNHNLRNLQMRFTALPE